MKTLLTVAVIVLVAMVLLLTLSVIRLLHERKVIMAREAKCPFMKPDFFEDDLLKTASWLGKSAEEIGVPAACLEENIAMKIGLEGKLFGQDAYGSAWFSGEEKAEDRRVEKINLYSRKLSFRACREYLKTVYEEPVSEGENTYVEVVGGALVWAVFEKDHVRARLAKGSNRSFVELSLETLG